MVARGGHVGGGGIVASQPHQLPVEMAMPTHPLGAMCTEWIYSVYLRRGVAVFLQHTHSYGRFWRMGPLGRGWRFPGEPATIPLFYIWLPEPIRTLLHHHSVPAALHGRSRGWPVYSRSCSRNVVCFTAPRAA
eukprot:COSAG06_NODE_1452_length_9430_cov_3.275426_2_plen_133_part_00